MSIVPADGTLLERVLDARFAASNHGLTRHAFGQFHAAQLKTAWGSRHQHTVALIDGDELLATATRYDFTGAVDHRAIQICGIDSIAVDAAADGSGHAATLVEHLVGDATRDGAELALLFSSGHGPWAFRNGFTPIAITDVELEVAQSTRHGAPMTLVRGGEERDLAAIAAMGQVRALPFRLHLVRDVDFVQYAVTKKRLLAGLSASGTQQLHFFIAEEGITAAAYVVISAANNTWTIEECGDRDVSGARVGAILQALIAREPVEARPTIRGWLPAGFVPPQVTITSARRARMVMLVRSLGTMTLPSSLEANDVLYWRNDVV